MFDGAITAWQGGATGQGVTVGIIDSGIDTGSPEFTGRISSTSAAFGGNTTYMDEDGHGTAVAGILAAAHNNSEIMGVAFDATIMALRTDKAGTCASSSGCDFFESDIAAALDRATSNGAKVVNISLGGSGGITSTLQQSVDRATRAGVIIVVAAGNERDETSPAYDPNNPSPFAMDIQASGNGLVIIVNSVDDTGQISAFSDLAGTSQNWVIGALGEGVRSLDLENDPTTYYIFSGTSFAAPQVSGAVALLADAFPNLSSAQIVDLLLRTARDAGATGTDSVYGRGILDIAAAFAPAGSTSLGSSAIPVSLTDNGTLSTAMGDTAGTVGTDAIAVDSIGRAYSLNLQATLVKGAPRSVLSSLREAPMRQATLGQGRLTATASFSGGIPYRFNRFGEKIANDTRRRSGRLSWSIDGRTRFGLAMGAQGIDLAESVGSAGSQASFLAARDASANLGLEPSPEYGIAFGRTLGGGVSIGLVSEKGRLAEREPLRADPLRTPHHYQQTSIGLRWHTKAVSLQASGSFLNEDDSLLGARLSPFFGVSGSHTLFADARADIALPQKWSLSLAARQGWTNATAGGSARIGTFAWSGELTRAGLLAAHDRFGIRIAQPLRVVSGGIDAMLPVDYDYMTGQSNWRMTRINLAPKGREIDSELSYGRNAMGGWIALNGYWRREPGNISWASDDIGGAIRFTIGY